MTSLKDRHILSLIKIWDADIYKKIINTPELKTNVIHKIRQNPDTTSSIEAYIIILKNQETDCTTINQLLLNVKKNLSKLILGCDYPVHEKDLLDEARRNWSPTLYEKIRKLYSEQHYQFMHQSVSNILCDTSNMKEKIDNYYWDSYLDSSNQLGV